MLFFLCYDIDLLVYSAGVCQISFTHTKVVSPFKTVSFLFSNCENLHFISRQIDAHSAMLDYFDYYRFLLS